MSERDEILAVLRGELPALRQHWPIRALALFGSVARNEAGPESDLDILVDFAEPVSLSDFLALEGALSALSGRQVELVSQHALKAHIGRRVRQEAVPV